MTTIPDDIMRVADNIANERFALGLRVENVQELADAIAGAILAERERCAKIAEQRFTTDTVTKNAKGKPYQTGLTAIYAAMHIADAIRSQS